jgi:hypothetical protein
VHLSSLGIAARGHPVDYLNPTTWTGDCGFFFPDGLIPVQFRVVGGKLKASVEYAWPL